MECLVTRLVADGSPSKAYFIRNQSLSGDPLAVIESDIRFLLTAECSRRLTGLAVAGFREYVDMC
jgi:hypothetical protein